MGPEWSSEFNSEGVIILVDQTNNREQVHKF